MRIHTTLTEQDLRDTLKVLQDSEDIADDIEFTVLAWIPSRSHSHSYEVRLGTHLDNTNPYRDNGKRFPVPSNPHTFAAAYDEWGFFLAALFRQDETMKTSYYKNCDDFHKKTDNKFR